MASQVTTRSAWIVAILFIMGGGMLLYWSGSDAWIQRRQIEAFLSQLGGALAATGLLTMAWDLVGRRAFANELLAKVNLSREVEDAGIETVADSYLEAVEWERLFKNVQQLDIVVVYGRTWRNMNKDRLQAVASRPGTHIRVFLPDPGDGLTVSNLADRFERSEDLVRSDIQEAADEFVKLRGAGGGTVEVYVRRGDALFSCYRFDHEAVVTLYSHGRKRRTDVPTFVVTEGGTLFRFVEQELEALEVQSRLITTGAQGGQET